MTHFSEVCIWLRQSKAVFWLPFSERLHNSEIYSAKHWHYKLWFPSDYKLMTLACAYPGWWSWRGRASLSRWAVWRWGHAAHQRRSARRPLEEWGGLWVCTPAGESRGRWPLEAYAAGTPEHQLHTKSDVDRDHMKSFSTHTHTDKTHTRLTCFLHEELTFSSMGMFSSDYCSLYDRAWMN